MQSLFHRTLTNTHSITQALPMQRLSQQGLARMLYARYRDAFVLDALQTVLCTQLG